MIPTIGRIVHYRLNEHDVNVIKQRREMIGTSHPETPAGAVYRPAPIAAHQFQGNPVAIGQVLPATIVAVFGVSENAPCNLQVHLDGNDNHWATSRSVGAGPGTFSWPARA